MSEQQFALKVTAPGISPEELDLLKEEIEKLISDPNHIIVTNYDFKIEHIGIPEEEE